MKLSVAQKFVAVLVVLLFVSAGSVYFVATHNYSQTLTMTLSNNIQEAQQNFAAITQATQDEYVYIAKVGAQFEGLAAAVVNKDASTAKNIAGYLIQNTNVNLVVITDAMGNVLVRGHSDKKGDSIKHQSSIAKALQGAESVGIVKGAVASYSLRASYPIKQNGTIVGTLSVGNYLENPKYLDWLANLLGVRVTFFNDDTRLMTTIKNAQGERIVGTRLNNPLIENTVLRQGQVYFGKSTIIGEDYLAAYWPARTYDGEILGMWFIGLPITSVLASEDAAHTRTVLTTLAVLFVMLVMAIYVGLRFTAPIKKLASYALQVADGKENASLHITSNDEFGTLAHTLQGMVAKLKDQTHWYKSVLDALPINVSVTDMDRNWLLVNAAGLKGAGKKLEDIIGLPCHTRGGNLCNTPDCGINRLEEGQPEAINYLPDGTVMHMRLSYLLNLQGEKIGHLEVGINITEQENAKKEAAIAAENVRRTLVQQLESVVFTLDEAAQQLLASVNDAETDARNTANHMMQVTTAIAEMESTIQDVAQNASNAAMDASSTQERAQNGHTSVQRVVSEILGVQNTSNALKGDMEKLSEHANSIGAILSIIRDIADQTNLLALNAAIEAARAGDAGRGFAVVADEVRKLAEKSMDATKDVESAIRIIQERTTESGKTMDSTVGAVRKATEEVQNAGETLSGIVDLSVSTAEGVSVIATAAEEQAATTGDISRTVADSSQLAQHLAASMENASYTVRTVSEQATMLRDILLDMKK